MLNCELVHLRQQIDSIDEALVELLGRRFRVTRDVGRLKATSGLGPIDAAREAAQERRLRSLAVQHGVNPGVVLLIFRAIVDEVVSDHRSIAATDESSSI